MSPLNLGMETHLNWPQWQFHCKEWVILWNTSNFHGNLDSKGHWLTWNYMMDVKCVWWRTSPAITNYHKMWFKQWILMSYCYAQLKSKIKVVSEVRFYEIHQRDSVPCLLPRLWGFGGHLEHLSMLLFEYDFPQSHGEFNVSDLKLLVLRS